MEAIFVQMLAEVEDVHRESLAFYIKALRGERNNDEGVFVALLTAADNPGELTNYQDFARKCARTEKQIIARSKGLLDVLDIGRRGRRLSVENLVWSIPQDAESVNLRLSLQRTREEVVKSRSPAKCSSSHQAFITFSKRAVSFVHRSAYDFLLSPECEKAIGALSTASSTTIQNDIVQARTKLLVAAPNPVSDYSRNGFRGRLATVIKSMSDYADLPSKSYEFLDGLQDLLLHFPLEELAGVTEETAEDFRNFLILPSKLYRQSLTLLDFWDMCIFHDQVDYVQDRLSKISELDCCGILYLTLIRHCLDAFSYEFDWEEKFSKLLLLITSLLKNLKQLYNGYSLVPSKQSLDFAEVGVARDMWKYGISWLHDKIPPSFHDDEIVLQMTEAFLRWNDIVQDLSSDGFSPKGSKPLLADHTEEINALFKAITDPWDIHIDTLAREVHLWSGRIVFFQISLDAFVQCENAARRNKQHGEVQSVEPIFESPPKLRAVCESLPEAVKGKRIIKRFKDSVVATCDLEPRVTSRVLKFLGITAFGYKHRYKHKETFVGNSEAYEECQQLMINDVWENAGGKLDAWQQLNVLAWLKTKLRDKWKFLDDEE